MDSILFKKTLALVAATLAIVAFVQTGFAQIGNDFPSNGPPIIDPSVMRTDFQREVEVPTERLNLELDFGDENTDSYPIEENSSVVDSIKTQLADLDLPRVFGSLAIVLGGYFGLVWFTRRFNGRGGSGRLPNEVVEVLGQTPFKPGYQLQLIRLGSKLLLLMNGPEGTHTIGEISDPAEVARLCAACGVSKPVGRTAPVKPQLPPSAPPPAMPSTTAGPNTDLKQILRQLQRVADDAGNGAVFEA